MDYPFKDTPLCFCTVRGVQETGSSAQKIYDAKDKISAANWKISGGSDPVSQYFDFKANVRKAGLYMQVRTIGGRVVFEGLNGMFAMVG